MLSILVEGINIGKIMIGRKIKEIRKRKGLTLTQVAEKANISKSYLSNIERDVNHNPSIHIIKKLAMVLEVDVRDLLNLKKTKAVETQLDGEWIKFVNELKEAGAGKEQIQEYRTLIEFIKWKNEHLGEKN